ALLTTGTSGGASITGGGTLVLGEAVITTDAGSLLTINTPVSGTNLTLAGPGTVQLPTANAFTGSTSLAGSTLVLGNTAAVGPGNLVLTAGTLSTSAGLALANAVILNNASVTLDGSNPLVFGSAGGVTLNGLNNTLT